MAEAATESSPEAAPRPEPVPDRLDVFISYSRTDAEFVRGLRAALVERSKDVYVDWEDIDAWSEDWQADLFTAIERAQTFVIVLSPEAAASPNVELELEHAIDQGKRIKPLHFRTVDAKTLPEAVRRPQWTDFRDEDAFAEKVAELVTALEADASWVEQHTRLLLRANEWDRRDGDAGLLLRGTPLHEAEAWLADQAGKDPAPTDVQGRFIAASRAAARTRQRRLFGAVVFALAVAIGLAIFSLVQRSEAISQKELAEERARIARSRELAASARARLGVDPELSLLLAAEAGRTAATTEAKQALKQALLASPVRRAVAPKAGPLEAVDFSPDGRQLLTVDGKAARLWRGGEQMARLDPGNPSVTDAVFDPTGKWIAVAFDSPLGGGVTLWDAETHEIVARLGTDTSIEAVSFSGDGKRVVGVGLGVSRVWDVRTRRAIARLRSGDLAVDAVLDRTGRLAVTSHLYGPALVWDVAREGVVARLKVDGGWNVDLSPNGRYAVTADDEAAHVWDLERGGRLFRRFRNASAVGTLDAVFGPSGDRIAVGGRNGSVTVWELKSRRRLAVLHGHTRAAEAVAFSPDGYRLASASADGTARIWEVARGKPAFRIGGPRDRFFNLSWDGRFATTRGPGGILTLWPLEGERRPARIASGVSGIAFSGDSRLMALWTANGVEIWDVRRRARKSTLRLLPGTSVRQVSFSPDNRVLATALSGKGPAAVWNAATGDLVERVRMKEPAWDVAYSPDGRHLAVVGLEGQTTVLDARSLAPVIDFGRAVNPDYLVDFSRSSRLLLTARMDVTARTWATDSWTEQTTMPVRFISGHAFSPREELAVLLDHGKPTLWDLLTGDSFPIFGEGTSGIADVAFTPDGEAVLAATRDGTIRRYPCDVCGSFRELLARAERRAARSFTADERRTYLHESL